MSKPDRTAFTKREWEIVEAYGTPLRAQRWLNALRYNREPCGGTLRSFREVVRRSDAHCLEAALAASVILEQHDYPPLLLSLESQDKLDHVVFLFQRRGLWGAVARSRDLGLHGRRPVFRSVRDLAWSYFDPYVDETGRITGYGVGNLDELGGYDWRFSERNVWKVERYLQRIPHRALKSSDERYERLLKRYREFKREHPSRAPDYFSHREHWML